MIKKGLLRKIISFLIIIDIVFVIHEYGHYSEMKERHIPVKEFSIGIGPVLYQTNINEVTVSLRIIPFAAQVIPTNEGAKMIENDNSLWDKFIIYSAGIRNNLVVAIIILFILELLAAKKGIISFSKVVPNLFYMTLKLFPLFISLMIFLFTLGKINFVDRFAISTKGVAPPKPIHSLLLWNLLLGLWNFAPLLPLDGGHIFIAILSGIVPVSTIAIIARVSSFIIIFIVVYSFTVGFGRIELVKFEKK